ncbi:MAG: response regulator [Elusimicrobia bacterium]|nr:response regulator [Elusimicrobiota bacterium]
MSLIMVAEDTEQIRDLLKDFLESRGHQVVTVNDGVEASLKAQEWKPDLIISDIMMPHAYGTTAYATLQESPVTASIPVIFVTAVALDKAIQVVPQSPKVRLLAKPIDFGLLESAIKELLPTA